MTWLGEGGNRVVDGGEADAIGLGRSKGQVLGVVATSVYSGCVGGEVWP